MPSTQLGHPVPMNAPSTFLLFGELTGYRGGTHQTEKDKYICDSKLL